MARPAAPGQSCLIAGQSKHCTRQSCLAESLDIHVSGYSCCIEIAVGQNPFLFGPVHFLHTIPGGNCKFISPGYAQSLTRAPLLGLVHFLHTIPAGNCKFISPGYAH